MAEDKNAFEDVRKGQPLEPFIPTKGYKFDREEANSRGPFEPFIPTKGYKFDREEANER